MSAFRLLHRCLLVAVVLTCLASDSRGWWRRRRRGCTVVNCAVNNWSSWSCSANCGTTGTKTRRRTVSRAQSNCGSCNYNLLDTASCSGPCCLTNCIMNSWGSWGSCVGCGSTCTQYRYRSVYRQPSCGGSSCPTSKSQAQRCSSCPCCSVNCAVNGWGNWGSCNAPCNGKGYRYRYRSISRSSACGGSSCPSTTDSISCIGGCCRVNCSVGSWSAWSQCSSSCGSGSAQRSRSILANPTCGGTSCPSTSGTKPCTRYDNRDCSVNSWSSYGTCQANSGGCGSGTRYRYRTISANAQCNGAPCPSNLVGSQSCNAGCCPVNCQVGSWGSWGSCSASCGSGLQYRTRSITRSVSCGGTSCPSLKDAKTCHLDLSRPCQVSSWSSWGSCSTNCGQGTKTRTRTVTLSALCRGSCPALSETTSCTSYSANKDCRVNGWGGWGSCSQKCSTGLQYRYRTVSQQKVCNGASCPSLSSTKACGQSNGGCQHYCNNGVCSCQTGYVLGSDAAACSPRSCGTPTIKFCPSGTTYGTTCKYPTLSCTGTTYHHSCSVACPSGYSIKNGPSTIVCLSSGAWTVYGTTYCRRNNDPPTKVSLSNSAVNENVAATTVVGTLSTSDPNAGDSHTYALLNSAGGKFTLSGTSLKITFSPDFESQPHSYTVKVRSTDKKGLYRDETFTIAIIDVNESPVSVSISNSFVNENSNKGTAVGSLSTVDPETNQKHTYVLVDSANGRFVLKGNVLQVAVSNARCLSEGGSQCLLNYESSSSYSVVIRSTDNGSPAKSKDFTLTIKLRDVNDKPRNLQLSGYTLLENSPVGTVVGTLSSTDEDTGQKLTYSLSSNASGRFSLSSGNKVVRKSSTGIDYETTTSYKITAVVQDNGNPRMSLSKDFTINVLNVNEPPVTIDFTSTNGQLSFTKNSPRVNENAVSGTVVGTIIAYDADANQKLAFKLDNTAGGRFALDSKKKACGPASSIAGIKTQCTIPVLVSGTLDHEVDAQHTIVVRATDQNNLFMTKQVSISIVDINDKPEDIVIVGGQLSIEENKNSALVGEFKTTDDDAADKHTYSLVNSANGKFAMSGNRLMTTASANIDYEVSKQLTIVVRSTDGGVPPLYVDKRFVVTVTDINEVPTAIRLTSSNVDENSAPDTVVGTLQTTDPDNVKTVRQSHTYLLLDSAQGRFKIVNGVVKVAVSNTKCLQSGGAECKLDYEKTRTYRILVRSTDNGSPSLQKDFNVTISLNDVNDRPRSLSIDKFQVKENEPSGTLVGTVSATDEDSSQALTFTLTDSDGGKFQLNGRRLEKAKSADYETKTSHTVTVKVTDDGTPSLSISKTFTIEVLDINEAPVTIIFKDTGGQLSFTDNLPKIKENSATSAVVGTVEVHDTDSSQKIAFSLDDSDNGRFSFSSATAKCSSVSNIKGINTVCTAKVFVAGQIDYEDTAKHTIIVRATDKGGLFKTAKFSIQVVDINDKPTDIQLAGGNPEVKENLNNAVVGELTATDDDNAQSHTYKLLSNAGGRFVIVGREVKVSANANLDYETASQYTIQVQATDNGSPPLSVTKSFVVKVLDVNEKPTQIHITRNDVNENSGLDTVVGTVSTSDPDNSHKSRQSFKYELLNTANGLFKVVGDVIKVAVSNTRCLSLGGPACVLNYEAQKQFDIVVRATDNGVPALSVDVKLTITLNDINDQPRSLDLSNSQVLENQPVGTVVGILTSSDEDKYQTITYSLTDDDGGRFQVVGNELQTAKVANYEEDTAHSVVVVAQDNGTVPLKTTRRFAIEVADVNEAPVNISIVDSSGQLSYSDNKPRVEEDSPAGTVVGTIESLDYDSNDTLTFRLDDDSNGMFALGKSACSPISDKPGINIYCSLSLVVAAPPNYEAKTNHYITIRVTDREGLFRTQRFNIEIVDVNDVPHNIELSALQVPENMNNALIGTFTTQDEDVNHRHTYTLVDNPGGRFTVKLNQLFTSIDANLDYEAQQTYNITIRSTDSGVPPLFLEETFTISITDVNEIPSLIVISNSKVQENSPSDTLVGVLTVTDPDNMGPNGVWQTHTCATIVNAAGRFVVDDSAVKVAAADINYEANATLGIVVRCTDTGTPPLHRDETFIIAVIDENELPTKLSMSGGMITENSPPQVVATFSTEDPDNEFRDRQNFTYAFVVLPQNLPFIIDGNELKTIVSLDYEQQQAWQLFISSTDTGGLSVDETFQITVIDINDKPSGISLAGTTSVPENSPTGTYTGQIVTADEDFNQTYNYRLLAISPGQNLQQSSAQWLQAFVLNPKTGQLSVGTAGLDYEVTHQFTLKIETTDSGNPPYSLTGTVLVTVTDINEPPANISLSASQVYEGSPINTSIGVFTVTDPDNEVVVRQSFTCLLVNAPHVPFGVLSDLTLVVADLVDYEQQSVYDLDVRCVDDGTPRMFAEKQFRIQVLDVNESPIDVALSSNFIEENQEAGSLVGIASCQDPDNEGRWVQNLTYGIQEGKRVPFAVNGTDVVSTRKFNYENESQYIIHLTAADDGMPRKNTTAKITIHILNVNDPPTFVGLVSKGVLENSPSGTVVGWLYTTDEDRSQSYSYSIIAQKDSRGLFAVNGSALIVASGAKLDFETMPEYTIVIKATDSGTPPLSVQDSVVLRIVDVNEAPSSIVSYNRFEINENSPPGTWLADLTVIDEDFNQTHTCRLLNGTQYFAMVGGDVPKIVVSSTADIDYEKDTDIWVNIECLDSGVPQLGIHHSFHVQVVDVNEPPTQIILTGSRNLREDVHVGFSVGRLSVIDDDLGQSHTFAVVGKASSAFYVDNSKRQLIVSRPIYLDFESLNTSQINVTLAVADDGQPPLSFIQTFTFAVININEPPIGITITGGSSISEDAVPGQIVGKVLSKNDENDQSVTYRIVDVDGRANSTDFYLEKHGNVTYLYWNGTVNYDNHSSFSVQIEAIDNGHPPSSSVETVTIIVLASDPCALGTAGCDANATCLRLSSTTSKCSCNYGYVGDGHFCRNILECSTVRPDGLGRSASLCNKGTCVDGIGTYTCACNPGYTGEDCSVDIQECDSSPCLGGDCLDLVNKYICQCHEGFTGVYCETNINDCALSPCGNGTCIDGVNDYRCECPDSLTGDHCSFPSDVCNKQTCVQSNCVPKSNSAHQITVIDYGSDGDPLPPVALEPVTGSDVQSNQNSLPNANSFVCVPDDYVVKIRFPADVNASSDRFQDDWERYLLNDLVVTVPANTKQGIDSFHVPISYIYITDSQLDRDGSTTVHFVVVVNDNAVAPYDVLKGLNAECVNGTTLPHSSEICQSIADSFEHSVTVQPQPQRSTPGPGAIEQAASSNSVSSQILWPVVGSVGAFTAIVALALLARWYVARRRMSEIRHTYNFEAEDDEQLEDDRLVSNPVYVDGETGERNHPDFDNPLYDGSNSGMMTNPIYRNSQANGGNPTYDHIRENDGAVEVVNPLNREFADVANPVYEPPEAQPQDFVGAVENAFYEPSGGKEATYEDLDDLVSSRL